MALDADVQKSLDDGLSAVNKAAKRKRDATTVDKPEATPAKAVGRIIESLDALHQVNPAKRARLEKDKPPGSYIYSYWGLSLTVLLVPKPYPFLDLRLSPLRDNATRDGTTKDKAIVIE